VVADIGLCTPCHKDIDAIKPGKDESLTPSDRLQALMRSNNSPAKPVLRRAGMDGSRGIRGCAKVK
jgi:hypothetical protein